jgi:dTDP-4-amino-4,6-dideoxygalactose transaminase
MTDMQAALGLCQLTVLDDDPGEPARPGAALHAAIAEIPHLEAPYDPPMRSAPGSPTACVEPALANRTAPS